MTDTVQDNPFGKWGMWAVIAGALAMLFVFIQIVGPTLETKPSAAQQVGEIAGEIRRAAWRGFLGLPQPEAQPVQPSLLDYLAPVGPVLGIMAILLSVVSGIRRENWRFAAYGTGLGATAIIFQFFWWVALLVMGILLLIAIIENIGDIFSF